MINKKIKRKTALMALAGILVCTGLALLTHLFCNRNVYDMAAVWIIGIGTVLTVVVTGKFQVSVDIKFIILFGYFFRVFLLLVAMSGYGGLAEILLDGDQAGFAQVAEQYFYGDYSGFYTKYPYVVNAVYQVAGLNRFVAQYINIAVWFLGIGILFKLKKDWTGIIMQILILLYVLMPYPAMLSMALLRESILGFLLMSGLWFLNKWMQTGQFRYMFFSLAVTFPAILLHSGMMSFWAGACLTYMFWNWRIKRWVFSTWKVLLLIGLGIAVILIYTSGYRIPFIMDGYIPAYDDLDIVLKGTLFTKARADYLTDLSYNSLPGFLFMVMMRCVYFWISPTPGYWNSVLDVIAFMADSIPCLIIIFLNIKQVIKDKQTGGGMAGMFILAFFTVFYGIGTRNAGTAMRHRDTILGLLVMNYILGKNQKTEKEMVNII